MSRERESETDACRFYGFPCVSGSCMRSIRYLKCGLGLLGPVSLGFGGLGCKVQGSGLECMASGIWVLWGFVGGGGWMCREFRVVCHGLLEVTWIRGVQVYPADPVARGKERFQSLRFCSARDDACLSESAGLCPVPTPNLAARGERPRLSDIHLRMSVHVAAGSTEGSVTEQELATLLNGLLPGLPAESAVEMNNSAWGRTWEFEKIMDP